MFAVVLLALLISVPVRADLRDPNNSADYIILTNQDVLSNNTWIDSLLDYRAVQGRVSMAVTVEEIWAEFTPSGSDTAIREFLHYAYENWQAPQLKDVFIVGHWDVVPSNQFAALHDSSLIRSDYLFSVRLQSEDQRPQFSVGRLPWSPRYESDLNNFGTKIARYESALPGTWMNRCHLIADSFCGGTDCDYWSEKLFANNIPEELIIERDYLTRPIGDDWYGDCEEIVSNINEGSLFTSLFAIASPYNLMPSCIMDKITMSGFTNGDALTIFSGTVSHALGVDTLDQVPAIFAGLNANGGGLIGALAFSAFPWALASSQYNQAILAELSDESVATIGSAWLTTCDSLVQISWPGSSLRETLFGTFLLGDPATIIPGRMTSVDRITAPQIPASIQIVGSYPNPFNPSTTIRFLMNRAGSARLTVFDITGRAVTTLADENFSIGEHNITWNAAGLASGMYLVRLESAGQFATHRITLLK